MSDFANLRDGGRRLGPLLASAMDSDPNALLLAALPNGVPVAWGIVESYALAVQALDIERSADGVVAHPDASVKGRTVIVVDDGVETGTVARAAGAALREAGASRLVLAVPICPREALAHLQLQYDLVVAVAKPFARRDLAWHYADFDTIDEARAREMLQQIPPK